MEKREKVDAILTEARSRADARTHYLPSERDSLLDPQRFFQRFPPVYALLKAIVTPTFTLRTWKTEVPPPSTHVVVNLGAGTTKLDPDMINVDFVAFPHIDVVADLLKPIPIKSGSVDAVVSISVLEHLESAATAVSETKRILKPGGTFYLATPFQFPFHGAPHDYSRWTLPGLRALLGPEFEIVNSGSRGGPMGVVILAFSHAFAQILCLGSQRVYSLVNLAFYCLLAPLKLADPLFSALPFSTMLSPGLFVTARKGPEARP